MSDPRENVHRGFGGQAHPGDIAPYVLVTGSKTRVEKIASFWDDATKIADHYELLVYTGHYQGVPVSACSTGIGGTSVSIAVEELAWLGAHTFLRVGVTSPLVDELALGEIVIARGAVRWDGASLDYVRPEYPALAHFEVILAQIAALEQIGAPYKVGVIGDMASLGPMRMEGHRKHLTSRTQPMRQALYELGVLDGTGESAVMFVQAALFGLRAGTMNINGQDPIHHRWDPGVDNTVIQAGLETLRLLAEWDAAKATGPEYIYPEFPAELLKR